jgi:hypothetical protein
MKHIISLMEGEKQKIRHFGGKLFVPKDGKERSLLNRIDKQFEEKHLKAYLRGDKKFFFGRDQTTHEPLGFYVKEMWF